MNRKILPVKPISQLFPIPMVMGCEGVSAAMMLQYNNQHIPATEIMRHWPTHPNNPHKGYVGHHLFIKLGNYHQTIFPEAYVPFLQKYNPNIVDGTGKSLEDLKGIIDQGQPVLIYHTNLGSKPLLRVFRFDNKPAKQVLNIHVTLLIGYDDYYYYYIDPLWSHIRRGLVLPAIIPNRKQIIKIRKEKMEYSFNSPGRKCIYVQPHSYTIENQQQNKHT
ncbi:TPA: C39 family peptidase [Staphylococcus aureus]|nr:C39 family peptidase [Staphylococcus aureus]HDH1259660.1 C39 family peptidase [Staphylococcus aureus]